MVVWLSDVLRLWYAGTAWPKEYHSFVLLLLASLPAAPALRTTISCPDPLEIQRRQAGAPNHPLHT